jgi:hypothetical protein
MRSRVSNIFRESARMSVNANSATVFSPYPGTDVTGMPRAAAAARSM